MRLPSIVHGASDLEPERLLGKRVLVQLVSRTVQTPVTYGTVTRITQAHYRIEIEFDGGHVLSHEDWDGVTIKWDLL